MARLVTRIDGMVTSVRLCQDRLQTENRIARLVRAYDPFQRLGKPCHL